jgi:hypothetical protein
MDEVGGGARKPSARCHPVTPRMAIEQAASDGHTLALRAAVGPGRADSGLAPALGVLCYGCSVMRSMAPVGAPTGPWAGAMLQTETYSDPSGPEAKPPGKLRP